MIVSSPLPRWRFWLALLGLPVLWLVHFLLVYGFLEATCNLNRNIVWQTSWSTLLINNLFILASLGITYIIYRDYTKIRHDPFDDHTILLIGFASGLIFTFALIIESVAFLFIAGCAS
jgi:hypothetical protein